MLKDSDDLLAKVAKLKPGSKIQLMGTPEGKELKAPEEKTVFEEDLSPEEKAKILKEKKVEIPPAGIKNLGNTCYMNATWTLAWGKVAAWGCNVGLHRSMQSGCRMAKNSLFDRREAEHLTSTVATVRIAFLCKFLLEDLR
eukprot:g22938.t1